MQGFGCWVWGLGFGVMDFCVFGPLVIIGFSAYNRCTEFRVQRLAPRVSGLWFRVSGLGFKVYGTLFGIQGLGFRVCG